MTLNSTHPLYDEYLDEWKKVSDTYAGSKTVKDEGQLYLPATRSMHKLGMKDANQPGRQEYEAYKLRAPFPDVVRKTVEDLVGAMCHKPPVVELPPAMEGVRSNLGETMEALLRRVYEHQLTPGRLVLVLDFAEDAPGDVIPSVCLYTAQHLRNWDVGFEDRPTLLVLDDSSYVLSEGFEWKDQEAYRVLRLDPESGVYTYGRFEGQTFEESEMEAPVLRGQTLDQVPAVIVNTQDLNSEPDTPALAGLAEAALTIYRGEADYRQALYMLGQDTLVIVGNIQQDKPDEKIETGAHAYINLSEGGSASYVGTNSQGLAEQRESLQNDKTEARIRGGSFVDTASRQKESGEALGIRQAAATANLSRIAAAGAEALEKILRICATWMGLDPEAVVVTPNTDFAMEQISLDSLVMLSSGSGLSEVWSKESMHAQLRKRGLTDMDFEDEQEIIAAQAPSPDAVDPEVEQGFGRF